MSKARSVKGKSSGAIFALRDTSPERQSGAPTAAAPHFEPVPEIMREIGALLEAKEHRCVKFNYHGKPNCKLEWCQKDVCPDKLAEDDMRRRHKEQTELEAELKRAGHVCIEWAECYPGIVTWCQKTPCKHAAPAAGSGRARTRQPK